MRRMRVHEEGWPLAQPFSISRGTKTTAEVVVVEIEEDGIHGRGECVPYPRYGETQAEVAAVLNALATEVEAGMDRAALSSRLAAGAARNALDCALWDLEAKSAGCRAWQLAGVPAPRPALTAETIALDTPDVMAAAATRLRDRPLLKIKVGAADVIERVGAVRAAAPSSRLIVDANEGWNLSLLERIGGMLAAFEVEAIEQPLPAAEDTTLAGFVSPVPLCADESCHTLADLERLPDAFRMVNVKLDKAGGLTEALRLVTAARASGREVMVGCMVATSLGVAPATLLTADATIVDLDGPLWLAHDRGPGLRYIDGWIYPPEPSLWG